MALTDAEATKHSRHSMFFMDADSEGFEVLRYMNVFGIRQDYKGAYVAVIHKMLDAIENGEGPMIIGNGEERFDFINVKDCALANLLAAKSKKFNSCYNVGTGNATSLNEIARLRPGSRMITLIETNVSRFVH